jgi:hypothetical protein
MKNVASKKQAITLIQSAVAAGFSRSVELCALGGRRLSVIVQLTGTVDKGGIHDYVCITIGFRYGLRRSINITTSTSYHHAPEPGHWLATYNLAQLTRSAARFGVKINAQS